MKSLRDRIRPGVRILFVGINPGIRSAQTGHQFAGYSNRFWKLLFESGLVPEAVTYEDDDRLPAFGYGITNICSRATPGIDTLEPEEFAAGRARLTRKIRRYRPRVVDHGRCHGVPGDVSDRGGRSGWAGSRNASPAPRSSCCPTRAAATPTSRTGRCWWRFARSRAHGPEAYSALRASTAAVNDARHAGTAHAARPQIDNTPSAAA
jgi:hypothetical protein